MAVRDSTSLPSAERSAPHDGDSSVSKRSSRILLAAGGGFLAVLVARLILYAAAAQVPPGFDLQLATDLQPGVLGALVLTVFLTLLVFGLWPALQTTRADTRGALAAEGGAVRWRTRRSLISVQVAVSAAFMFVAAMCVETVVSDWKSDSGIDVNRLALATVNFDLHQQDEARARVTMDRMMDRARREPSVEVAALSSSLPFEMGTLQASLAQTDRPFTRANDGVNVYFVAATPEIFLRPQSRSCAGVCSTRMMTPPPSASW